MTIASDVVVALKHYGVPRAVVITVAFVAALSLKALSYLAPEHAMPAPWQPWLTITLVVSGALLVWLIGRGTRGLYNRHKAHKNAELTHHEHSIVFVLGITPDLNKPIAHVLTMKGDGEVSGMREAIRTLQAKKVVLEEPGGHLIALTEHGKHVAREIHKRAGVFRQ